MIIPVLSVADVDASVKFYTEKLGFTQEFAFPGPDGKNTFASVKLGEAHVMVGTDSDLASVGKGVAELRIKDASGEYRSFYFCKLDQEVIVFHAFMKKTQKTSQKDLDLGKKRLKEMIE